MFGVEFGTKMSWLHVPWTEFNIVLFFSVLFFSLLVTMVRTRASAGASYSVFAPHQSPDMVGFTLQW